MCMAGLLVLGVMCENGLCDGCLLNVLLLKICGVHHTEHYFALVCACVHASIFFEMCVCVCVCVAGRCRLSEEQIKLLDPWDL